MKPFGDTETAPYNDDVTTYPTNDERRTKCPDVSHGTRTSSTHAHATTTVLSRNESRTRMATRGFNVVRLMGDEQEVPSSAGPHSGVGLHEVSEVRVATV